MCAQYALELKAIIPSLPTPVPGPLQYWLLKKVGNDWVGQHNEASHPNGQGPVDEFEVNDEISFINLYVYGYSSPPSTLEVDSAQISFDQNLCPFDTSLGDLELTPQTSSSSGVKYQGAGDGFSLISSVDSDPWTFTNASPTPYKFSMAVSVKLEGPFQKTRKVNFNLDPQWRVSAGGGNGNPVSK